MQNTADLLKPVSSNISRGTWFSFFSRRKRPKWTKMHHEKPHENVLYSHWSDISGVNMWRSSWRSCLNIKNAVYYLLLVQVRPTFVLHLAAGDWFHSSASQHSKQTLAQTCRVRLVVGRIEVGSCSHHKWITTEFFWDQTETPSSKRSWCGCFGPRPSAIALFRCVQINCSKGEKQTRVQHMWTKMHRFEKSPWAVG